MVKIPATGLVLLTFYLSGISQPVGYDLLTSPRAKKKEIKGWLYGSLGWHRIFYTNSTIYFRNHISQDYDFRLIKARAIDDNDLNIGRGIDAPQWSVRFGYLFNKKIGLGIELSYDHAKYVLKQGQRVRLQGNINGKYYDRDTILRPDFIAFEHTDGANYYMLSLIKRKPLSAPTRKHMLDLLLKAGAGPVIPRTDSRIMGYHYNEHYHISGFVAGVETSLRYEFIRYVLAELSIKGAYANYSDILLYYGGRASQHWGSLQFLFTVAYQLPVNKKK